MKFSEIQRDVATDQAIAGIQKHVPAISLFARSFTPNASNQFTGVAVPVFANASGANVQDAANLTSDIWCDGEELQGAVVSLEKNISKAYAFSDYAAATTDDLYLADGARAIADQVTLDAVKYVFTNVLADANLSTVQTLSDYTETMPTTKTGFAGLFGIASDKGANPYDCVIVLNTASYSALMGAFGDSYVYGGPEMIRTGVVEGFYGFRGVVCSPFMPEGTKGFIIPWNSLGVVSRWDKPAIDGYADTWTALDPKTGFTIGYRVFENLCKGKAYIGGNVLFGAKVLQAGIITLK